MPNKRVSFFSQWLQYYLVGPPNIRFPLSGHPSFMSAF